MEALSGSDNLQRLSPAPPAAAAAAAANHDDPLPDAGFSAAASPLTTPSPPDRAPPKRGGGRGTAIGVIVLVAIIFVVDLALPDNILMPVLYVVPLLLAARVRREQWVTAVGGAAVVLTFLDTLVENAPIQVRWYFVYINRGIAALSLLVAMILLNRIITTHKELERRRREAEAAAERKVKFLAAVSHDIRTPANAINLLAELMRRTAGEAAAGNGNGKSSALASLPEIASDLQSASLSMLQIVSDVLDVTRFDFGKTELQLSELALGEFLEEQARQHRPMAEAKGLRLVVDPPCPAGVRIRSDRVNLARVLSNLLGNAVKFTEKGSVTIRPEVCPGGQAVRIAVADTGIGINAEHLPRIFDEYYQIKNPARDKSKGGTGLGLAIAKRLVEILGGRLEVQSVPGRGTTFTISLPAGSGAA
jgi:signal transduction histidine kinase